MLKFISLSINVSPPSILTQEFKKSEIKTVEELFEKIENSPISPKPHCESLQFTWNWRDYIQGYLTEKKLKNHSFYNGFKVEKENGQVKLRCKRLPQDLNWLPPTGIRIVQPDTVYEPVGCAQFRTETLLLPKIVANLEKYFRRMPTALRVKVTDSWLKLKDKLERVPKMQNNLPKMKIFDLPKMPTVPTQVALPDEYSYIVDNEEDGPEIEGDVFEEGLFACGLDVVIYSECRDERPWLGRVEQILDEKRFVIHWFRRHGKSSKFHAMMNDGKPYLSELEYSNVMMWDISTQRLEKSFYVTPYRLAQIGREYTKYDASFGDNQ